MAEQVAAEDSHTRRRLIVTGVVQGVGFRPFVYALAQAYGLAGFVGNESGGVFIEVEGPAAAVDGFRRSLETDAPPLAFIEQVTSAEIAVVGEEDFRIVLSQTRGSANTMLSPDVCICADCLADIRDPADRRYRYPFTNCTNCGPRFTIIQDIPYDRPLTTMAPFVMCSACQAEYEDPSNRRFHAQPNACPLCGPQVWLEFAQGNYESARGEEALQMAQRLLASGGIVAVKGLGGFHLACDAANDTAVAKLRERKGRVAKPFAVMALNLEIVRRLAHLSAKEADVLTGRERPIVLLDKLPNSPLCDQIAPGAATIGVMLPYTPLHYLLLEQIPLDNAVLVMTSGNYSNEPIVKDNEQARRRLGSLADAFLFHDRRIESRCDDSVVRLWRGMEMPLRRSRGYAPFPVKLPFDVPEMLAVGGELKATFCVTKGRFAYLSQHIGDMENLETLEAFEQAVAHFQHVFRIEPVLLACDTHPRYLSSRWARDQMPDIPVIEVQHHHAHIAALMGEHGLAEDEIVIGFSFDGTGYGSDGAVWGGEVLAAGYRGYERLAHLAYMPLPGGDVSIKRPYRLALAYLWSAGLPWDERLAPIRACPAEEKAILLRQLEAGLNTIPNSSMGRLFDVVSSLAGVCQIASYEGQAAIELETLVDLEQQGAYQFVSQDGIIDVSVILRGVTADILSGLTPQAIAARFHRAVAGLIHDIAVEQRARTGCNVVALSGGVFQNVTLLELAVGRLEETDFQVLTHRQVPANDGGLALGQALIAAQIARNQT